MHWLNVVEHFVRAYATQVPLPWFVFIGSFLEEVISPIPSAFIMGTAGSLALFHKETLWYLLLLALIGNIGKTLGAWLYYFLGDKLEDLLIRPITKYLGVRHEDIQSIGARFTGHHWKDGGVLFLLRLLPPFPTTPVSLAAGIIKMDLRVFLVATYAGNFFKDLLYLYAGYIGLAKLHTLWRTIEPIKFGVDILVAIAIIVFLILLYMHRVKGQRFFEYCRECFRGLLRHLNKK
ncbi:MAG: VTT domain-containing protein [Candidatus Moranbacteria bacterium]|nr:VTT domain-containing protein [Candidatus Moranbacteria bacterium]